MCGQVSQLKIVNPRPRQLQQPTNKPRARNMTAVRAVGVSGSLLGVGCIVSPRVYSSTQ
jgi:hypothetical protein